MTTDTITSTTRQNEWNQAGQSATDAAASVGEMAEHAACAAGGIVKEAASAVGQQADDLTARAGTGIDQLGQMLGRNTPQHGVLGNASQAVAHSIQRGGQYLEEAKLSGTASMVTELIRQHPVAAVLTGIAAGFLISRALKD